MSYADFQAACAEIDASSEADFSGPKSDELVASAEAAIGFKFPPTYRDFLLRYGCGDIHGHEFYGITHGDFQNSGIPNAIWLALADRKEWQFPHHLLAVYEPGDGSKSCLDFTQRREDGECPVVIWHPLSEAGDRLEVEAEDFGQLLLTKIKEASA
jgi:antitoxin YobK